MSFGNASLRCDRPSQTCTLSYTTLRRRSQDTFPLDQLQGARVRTERVTTDGDHDTTDQVMLQLPEGEMPLTPYTTNNSFSQAQADRINRFLAEPDQDRLAIANNDLGWAVVVLVIFVGSGVLLLVSGQRVTWIFDRGSGQFIQQRWGLRERQTQRYPLPTIAACLLESQQDDGSETSRLCLLLKTGEYLPLTGYSSGVGRQRRREICQEIQAFLRPTGIAAGAISAAQPLPLPAAPNPREILAWVRGGKQARQQAIADYRQRLQENPDSGQVYQLLAMVLMMNQQVAEAQQVLTTGRDRFLQQEDWLQAAQMAQALGRLPQRDRRQGKLR
ncbi:MAG: tetratricopeptide repeat protein [Leptolyngbya sp.]|nr:tetratricopeptide repeat protein [Leptolyngbya sp.]